MQVYSLVSRAKRHSLDFTQLPPGHRTCSFISNLSSPGSIHSGCHFRRIELFKHTSLHCPTTRYPLTPGSRECTCEQSALSLVAQRRSIIQPSRGSNPRSLACKSRTPPLSHDTPIWLLHYICEHFAHENGIWKLLNRLLSVFWCVFNTCRRNTRTDL